ncbi:MAG: carboxymuconolactone decarboxylase family protein [Proteobacteria bacterium]|nr:carboxymuconolactone decarboxylase family protein [Pseudomonadota bacterium]
MTSVAKLSLPGQTPETASDASRALLEDAKRRIGFIPAMYANMANSAGMFDTYIRGYDHFRGESGFSPPEQEVVFLTISVFNGCTYCVAAHSFIAQQMSKVPSPVLEALRQGKILPDRRLEALATFTRIMVGSRGRPAPEELREFLEAGFTERHVLEIILAIAVKTLSNYSNHLFHAKPDPAFEVFKWSGPAVD